MITTIINNKTISVSFDKTDIEVTLCTIEIDNIKISEVYSFNPDITDVNANTIIIQNLQERNII